MKFKNISLIEFFFISIIIFIVVMAYFSNMKPFEKVSFWDVEQHKITLNYQVKERCSDNLKFIISLSNEDQILAQNDKFIATKSKCGYLKLIDKKTKKLLKKFDLSDKEIVSTKFFGNFLYVYQKGIYKIDLTSFEIVAKMENGITGIYAEIFPLKEGIVVFVRKESTLRANYLIFYKYTTSNKNSFPFDQGLKWCNIYKLKPLCSSIFMHNGELHINLNDRIYKIYPKRDELKYEVE